MTLLSRRLFAALAVLLFVSAPAAAQTPPSAPWPQTGSDLPADVSVRFGTLPNGMRYAIKHNATPIGAMSIRFRIDAGSLMERDDEQGIAHMLEHMAFRGSAHVADGDTVRILQSLGLAFGADTNAFTASTQTVYSFDMPKNDTASVDTALMLLREIAGELNITKEALDTERNVVLAEAHTRDVPVSHLRKSDLAFLYGDRTAAAMTPIGLENIVANATPQLVRGFYEAWYRPERATLIIVGDVDPAELEAKIKAKFSDWTAKAAPRTAPVYAVPAQHAAQVKLFAEPGAPPYMFFDFLRPYDPSPDNVANEARDVLRFIALGVVNQRFERLAHGTNPPFVSASASHEHVDNVADATEIGVSYRDGQALDGAKAVERTWRDAVLHGVRQDEVDSVVSQFRTFFEGNAAAADTTPSAQVVASLLRAVDEKTVFTAPSSDLALYEAVVKNLTAAKVSESLKYVFGGDGPLVFTSASSPLAGGEAAFKAALAQADGSPLAAGISGKLPPWPYGNFGKPGTVADKRTVDDLGVTYVRFANGVTLTVKPTQLHVGQILMTVHIGKGRLGLPRDHVAPAWALSGAFTQAGLRRYGIDDLQKRMSDKFWGTSFGTTDDAFALNGQARASDLDAEMQVLAAYVTDPSWQPEAFDQMRIASAADYAQTQASPAGLLSREFSGLLHGGDPRWRAPTLAEINAATVGDEKALLAPALASGPLDITVVGDVTVDQAIHSVAATFGALPPRPARAAPVPGDETFPPGTSAPVVLTHHGAPNQAVAAIAWPTAGFYRDMKLQRTLRVLMEVFGQRLLDVLRTREGITYTPGAQSYSSLASPDYGFIYALAQIPPDKIAEFYKQVAVVADDLTANPITPEEIDRFRGPRIQDIQKQQQTNEYWLQLLAGSAQDPRLLDVIRSTLPDLKSVTPEDVQKAAKDWLKDDKAFLLVVAPPPPDPQK